MLQTVLYCGKLHSMSEEYTQSKAYLDNLMGLGQLEPASVMIARLRVERDAARREFEEARDSAKFWEGRFDVCGSQLKRAEMERDSAREERDEANAELDKAVCDLVDRNNELQAARAELAKLQDRKLAEIGTVQRESFEAQGRAFRTALSNQLKRPVGYLQSLEARIKTLEGVVNAR